MGDPDGGSWPAYPSGKSWDARSGPTGSGKKFYHNVIPGSAVATENFYVAIITPVIHYCMGGLAIDESSRVLNPKNQAIAGLYATGEVAGGVHGNNRLGGNSLLDCVVFGRVAAEHCAKYMLGADVKKVDLKRFANELGRRDYVTGEMWKNKAPFRLVLNKKASDEIIWHCKHYTGRGVMKYYETGEALAKDMGVTLDTLIETHAIHATAAANTEK